MNVNKNHLNLLKTISRKKNRELIKENNIILPFHGKDLWTLYEVSWLNEHGLPQNAIVKIEIDAYSVNIIESKSLKIYINSFNNIKFKNYKHLLNILEYDLKKCVCGKVDIFFFKLNNIKKNCISDFNGTCIDNKNVNIKYYNYNKNLLINSTKNSSTKKNKIEETLYSNLLKSNCPITNQPDWASIQISYTGYSINHDKLLSYLISFRNHNGFHEDCVEQIFYDIDNICKPEKLTVYARYMRRGGIDINPWRSNTFFSPSCHRLVRQ